MEREERERAELLDQAASGPGSSSNSGPGSGSGPVLLWTLSPPPRDHFLETFCDNVSASSLAFRELRFRQVPTRPPQSDAVQSP